jgi:hypothetical protein
MPIPSDSKSRDSDQELEDEFNQVFEQELKEDREDREIADTLDD